MSHLDINTLDFRSQLIPLGTAFSDPSARTAGVSLWQGRFVTFNGEVAGLCSLDRLSERFITVISQIHSIQQENRSAITLNEANSLVKILFEISNLYNETDAQIANAHILFQLFMAFREWFCPTQVHRDWINQSCVHTAEGLTSLLQKIQTELKESSTQKAS